LLPETSITRWRARGVTDKFQPYLSLAATASCNTTGNKQEKGKEYVQA